MNTDLLNLDIAALIKSVGYVGLFLIIFAESGVFFGFFLPGGSLLFTAGLLASQGFFSIWILIPLLAAAAILGDNVGYWFGKRIGPKIFTRDDSFFFNKKHIEKTQRFYATHGPRAIVLGRFIPIVRTFAPILAGVGLMNYSQFIRFNILGALLWAVGVAWLGYFLGNRIPGIDQYILPIILLIVITSLIPLFLEMRKKNKSD